MRRLPRFVVAFVLTTPLPGAVVAAAESPKAAPLRTAGAPTVTKVEPPNWWPGHSINPVRLMLRGTSLQRPRVDVVGEGLSVGLTRVNAAGTYLFVDVGIDPKTKPGPRRLRVTTAAGTTEAPFEVSRPLPREGRFQGFSPDDVMYLVMPDRFANGDPSNDDPTVARGLLDRSNPRYYHGGDLKGIIDRLPYLHDLDITALWLNPWYDNANDLNRRQAHDGQPVTDYHGYGAVDVYAVEEHFGELATLRELVDTAHAQGIKVIQDQVANHTGPYHPWTRDSPTSTWFNGTQARHLANPWQTWTLTDPHAAPETQKATLEGWFVDVLPDLNQDDEEVARYTIQNTLWWVGTTGLDGIRQDTLPYVHRRFWRDWMAAIKREYPDLRVVGEMFDGDPSLVSFFQGGQARLDGIDSGIDALFDFPLYYKLRETFTRAKPLRDVAGLFGRDRLYPDASVLVTFLGLHDVPRFMSEPGADAVNLKLAFTLLFTARGTPLVYYGDEIAMRGGEDPDNRRDFPGGWPADPRNAFEAGGRSAEEESVHAHVRRLAQLRAELRPLRRGAMVTLLAGEQTMAFARVAERESVVVAINSGTEPAGIDCDLSSAGLPDGAVLRDRLGTVGDLTVAGSRLSLTLPARSAAVLVRGR